MDLKAWIGKSETVADVATATPCAALAATLDRPADRPPGGTPLPPLWHWLYFLPLHRQSELGPDGHARRGGFLPPVPLPRRMWAGSQFRIRTGHCASATRSPASRRSRTSPKSPAAPALVFVKVRHEIRRGDEPEVALTEFHDIVYREAPKPEDVPPAPQRALAGAAWERKWVPDEVLLFRYSALTFNGHRIHYDRRYVTEVEGYPGLVVHGPLVATLLLDLLRHQLPDAVVTRYAFRAVRPVFDIHPFFVCGEPQADGRTIRLWARDHDGWLTMDASATVG